MDIIPSLYICTTEGMHVVPDILDRLPAERRCRIRQAVKPAKALQLYASSLLLGYALRQYGKELDDVRVAEFGKPYVEDALHFNLSHSGQYVVLAMDREEVGVDVQEKTPVSNAAAKFFLNGEDDLRFASQTEYGYAYLWCRKEAFLKCLGVGWSGKKEAKLSVRSDKVLFANQEYFLTDFPISEDYFLTLCEKSSHKDFAVEVVSKDAIELFY